MGGEAVLKIASSLFQQYFNLDAAAAIDEHID